MNLLWFYQHVLRCGCGWYAPRHSKCLQRLSQNFKHLMNCRHKTVTCPNLQKYPTKWGWVTMINLRNRYKWININIHVYCMCIYIYISLSLSLGLNMSQYWSYYKLWAHWWPNSNVTQKSQAPRHPWPRAHHFQRVTVMGSARVILKPSFPPKNPMAKSKLP